MSMEMDYNAAGAMASMEKLERWVEQSNDETTIKAWRRLREYVETLAHEHHRLDGRQRDLKRALQQSLTQIGHLQQGPEVNQIRETLVRLSAY